MCAVIVCPEDCSLGSEDLAKMRDILEGDGLIVYPAGNLYGLGASIRSRRAVARMSELKTRPEEMGISIMGTAGQARELCDLTPMGERFLTSQDLEVTAVLPASNECQSHVRHAGTLALRLAPTTLCESMVSTLGPLTATSANIHGDPAPTTVAEALGQLGGEVALYIDGGGLSGIATTVVDMTGSHPKVLREGMVSEREVLRRYGR